jgi:hypothetical protein
MHALHLTIQERNDEIERALLWLYEQYKLGYSARGSSVFINDNEISKKIPFMACDIEFLLTSSLLFLTGVFNWEEHDQFPSIFIAWREEVLHPERHLPVLATFLTIHALRNKGLL